jgi:hypothetical protein
MSVIEEARACAAYGASLVVGIGDSGSGSEGIDPAAQGDEAAM